MQNLSRTGSKLKYLETYLYHNGLSRRLEYITNMTANQQSGMQPSHKTDMFHFLIDFLTLSNEAGQGLIQLLWVHFYLQWLLGGKKKPFWKAWDLQTINSFFFFCMNHLYCIQKRTGAWQYISPSPAALSWLISLSVSLGHLLITNQKASLTSHKRRRTGADSGEDGPPRSEPRSTKKTGRGYSERAGPRSEMEEWKGVARSNTDVSAEERGGYRVWDTQRMRSSWEAAGRNDTHELRMATPDRLTHDYGEGKGDNVSVALAWPWCMGWAHTGVTATCKC